MTQRKIIPMALSFLLFSSPCLAYNPQNYMSISLGAKAKFVYVQSVNAIIQNLTMRIDVTSRVPYEVQTVNGEKILVIS